MTFGIIGNLEKEGLREAVERLVSLLESHGIKYIIDAEIVNALKLKSKHSGSAEECAASEILVAFGGDGTILHAARLVGVRGTPVLGVNLGKLGFLAEIAPEEMDEAIVEIVSGKYIIEERLVLEGTSSSMPGKTMHAVNDIVIDKSRSPRLIDLATHIDGVFAVNYRADGLIISTPTGSTGYALSSGGPIVTPTSAVIGITPISPHTLSGRPLIVPEATIVRVIVNGPVEEVMVSADGQVESFGKPPVELQIKKADYTLKLVKRMGRSYFDVLRAKLLWGKDARSL
ncbi:MAG: NAD(+)/NADH kinase [Bacteroidota bacterium]